MVSGKDELGRELHRLVAVLEGLGVPAAVVGLDRVIVAANRGYEQRYSMDLRQGGGHCFEVTHGSSRPCSGEAERCPIQWSLVTGRPYEVQHTHISFKREHRVTVLAHPIRSSSGKITAFLQTLRPLRDSSLLGIWPALLACPAFRRLSRFIDVVAPTSATVLIRGEVGSGRELVARSLHDASLRRDERFVPIDCTGVGELALEVELFGEPAPETKRGLLGGIQARGTVFLNEVGALGLSSQNKLLCLLEEGRSIRIGDSKQRKADFRLISSARHDLERKIAEGFFNRDLFRLISLTSIDVPPLRSYLRDLPLFVESFVQHLSDGRVCLVAPSAVELLQQRSFPGNIRELMSVLERACICADGDTLLPEHLP